MEITDQFDRILDNGWGDPWTDLPEHSGVRNGYAYLINQPKKRPAPKLDVDATELTVVGRMAASNCPRAPGIEITHGWKLRWNGKSMYFVEFVMRYDQTARLQIQAYSKTGKEIPGGTGNTPDNGDRPFLFGPAASERWYWLKVKLTKPTQRRTRIQTRLWIDGEDEPRTWHQDLEDTHMDLQGSGYVGFQCSNTSDEPVEHWLGDVTLSY